MEVAVKANNLYSWDSLLCLFTLWDDHGTDIRAKKPLLDPQ